MSKFLCFGEISWDLLELDGRLVKEGPGGCSLNTAWALRALGAAVTLSGNPLGDDLEGRSILDRARARGVDARFVLNPELRTPVCRCLVEAATGERGFSLSHEFIQTLDPKLGERIIPELAREIRCGAYSHIFVQPYVREASRLLLRAIQDCEQVWICVQDLAATSEFVPMADAIQISLDDAKIPFESAAVAEFAQPYFQGRMREVFLTAGALGVAYVPKDGSPIFFPGVRAAKVVDTTGCGDAFRAGLMSGLAGGRSVGDAIALGQKMGAAKAEVEGSIIEHDVSF